MTTYIVQFSKGRRGNYSNFFYGVKNRALEIYATIHLAKHNKKRLIAVRGVSRKIITKEYKK